MQNNLQAPAALARAPYLEAPALQSYTLHLRHGFFGRNGGVSNGVYKSLNAGHGSDDLAENVTENRNRICASLGAEPGQLVTAHQAHTTRTIIVDEPFEPGKAPKADALVTDRPGLVIAALAADCAPVLMCDPHAGVAAAAHAGWRGAVDGVVENAVEVMEGMGAEANRIIAAIGPCLTQASFEVGPEFAENVLKVSPWADKLFIDGEGDREHFDLKRYLQGRLARLGVGKIEAVADDTLSEPDLYFSYRRGRKAGETDYGRNASAIVLVG